MMRVKKQREHNETCKHGKGLNELIQKGMKWLNTHCCLNIVQDKRLLDNKLLIVFHQLKCINIMEKME